MKNGIKKIFQGRLGRKHFFLTYVYILMPMAFAITILGSMMGMDPTGLTFFMSSILFPIIIIPTTVRRLHDLGLSGWIMIAILLIPYIGSNISMNLLASILVSGYLFLYPGKSEPNKYGNPEKDNIKFWDAILNKI